MDITVKIVTGEDAVTLIDDNTFVSSWKTLSAGDKKVTVMQEPPFVITWYHQYSGIFKPILCIGYSDNNEVVGIMPLSLSLKSGYISHAGNGQAEYHGWISRKEFDNDFPIACLIAIKKAFSLRKWRWGWIPPQAQTNWLFSPLLEKANIYVKFTKQQSPVWDLRDEGKINKIIANRSIATKINRYRKMGSFYIERVKDKDKSRHLLEIVKNQYDFRQLAANKIAPFESDPNKIKFHIEKMGFPDDNHFTVLWSNNKPIAFHFGECDEDTVYLGISSFDPIESKNSPGTLLLLEAAALMRKEGYHYLDLTPGGDKFKDRFANSYQELIRPTFYFSSAEKLKADIFDLLIKALKKGLLVVGVKPDWINSKLNATKIVFDTLRRANMIKIIKKACSLVYEKRVYLHYRILKDEFDLKVVPQNNINIQNYSDLLLYAESNPWVSRSKLVLEAEKRFSAGEVLYSAVKSGVLAHYGWLIWGGKTHRFTEVDMEFKSPPGSTILYDFYTDPNFRRQGLYQLNINRMLYDSFNAGAKEAYIGTSYQNIPSRTAIEKNGFKLFKTFINMRLLWFTYKREVDG